MKHFLLSTFFLMATCHAKADLLPPDLVQLEQRARANPALADRTDQYCVNKEVGSTCQIPGSPFQGGGNGTCLQDVNHASRTVDRICHVSAKLVMDRNIPDSSYQVSVEICKEAEKSPEYANRLASEGIHCGATQAVPTDRFCRGKATGDSCKVTYRVTSSANSFEETGVCSLQVEERTFYLRGRSKMQRQLLLCMPTQQQKAVMTEVPQKNWWEKFINSSGSV